MSGFTVGPSATFNLLRVLQERAGENYALHSKYINPQFAKVLRLAGFDRCYERGCGSYLFDTAGQRYLDLLCGWNVFNVGRNHPVVKQAIVDVLSSDPASLVQRDCSLLSGLVAEKLVQIAPPPLDTVLFSNGGAETVEGALKFARKATRKSRFLYCKNSFHGLTFGALSVTDDTKNILRAGFGPLLPGCTRIPFQDLEALESELKEGDVAAFIAEPIQGETGIIIPEARYWSEVRRLCDQYGALMIFDEIQTGLGRTGKWLACEHWNVVPDVLCLSKALGAGLVPVGAVMTRRDIFLKVFNDLGHGLIHSSTYGGNAVAMAAALATLHVIEQESLLERATQIGARFKQELERLRSRYELLTDVRQIGLMIGVQFGEPKSFTLRQGWNLLHKMRPPLFGQSLIMALFDRHRILAQMAGADPDCLQIFPPLIVGEEELAYFLQAFEDILKDCHRFPGIIWEQGVKVAKHALSL
jgi:acetylornithine/succinyldiaminopimelate/putrescine aminotransferase